MKVWGILGILFSVIYVIMSILWIRGNTSAASRFANLPDNGFRVYQVDWDFAGVALGFAFFMFIICLRLIWGNRKPVPYTDSKILDDL